jgi:hypothetical protein
VRNGSLETGLMHQTGQANRIGSAAYGEQNGLVFFQGQTRFFDVMQEAF